MIKKFLFGTSSEETLFGDISMTFLRVSAGVLMLFLHGLGKFPVSQMFIDAVGGLGFPMPILFAWLAMIAELVGSIFLILGLFTRPSAFLLAITMFVATFGRHINDPWKVKELAFIYFAIFVVFTFKGASRFSVDRLIK